MLEINNLKKNVTEKTNRKARNLRSVPRHERRKEEEKKNVNNTKSFQA